MKNETTTIASKETGMRNILNTHWPVSVTVERQRWYGKTTWLVTWGICNGTAGGNREFRTRREAMELFDSYSGER